MYYKITIIPKTILDSMQSYLQITNIIFADLEQEILKFVWKNKSPQMVPDVKKNGAGAISLPDFRLYYKATKSKYYVWHKDRLKDQWNRRNKPTHLWSINLTKGGKNIQQKAFSPISGT